MQERGAAAGILQVHIEVDVRLGAATAVAPRAVGLHEGFHLFLEGLPGVGPERRLIRALTVGLRQTR